MGIISFIIIFIFLALNASSNGDSSGIEAIFWFIICAIAIIGSLFLLGSCLGV